MLVSITARVLVRGGRLPCAVWLLDLTQMSVSDRRVRLPPLSYGHLPQIRNLKLACEFKLLIVGFGGVYVREEYNSLAIIF